MTQKHTKEPWNRNTFQIIENLSQSNWNSDKLLKYKVSHTLDQYSYYRAIDCVNALAGIDNPKEWVDKVTTENTMLKKVLRESDNTLITISCDGVKPIRLELEEQIEKLKSERAKRNKEINIILSSIEGSIAGIEDFKGDSDVVGISEVLGMLNELFTEIAKLKIKNT